MTMNVDNLVMVQMAQMARRNKTLGDELKAAIVKGLNIGLLYPEQTSKFLDDNQGYLFSSKVHHDIKEVLGIKSEVIAIGEADD